MTSEQPSAPNRPVREVETYAEPRIAELYDTFNELSPTEEAFLDVAAELTEDVEAPVRILDIGCGTGTLAAALAEDPDTEVTGLEPSEAMLAIARQTSENVEWVLGDARALEPGGELADEFFDLILMTGNVSQEIEDDAALERTLLAAARCIAAGGALVFDTRNPDGEHWKAWAAGEGHGEDTTVEFEDGTSVEVAQREWNYKNGLLTWTSRYEFPDEVLEQKNAIRFRPLKKWEQHLTAGGWDTAEFHDLRAVAELPARTTADGQPTDWLVVARQAD